MRRELGVSSLEDIEEERELKQMVRTILYLLLFMFLQNYCCSSDFLIRETGLQCKVQSMSALGPGLRC